MTRTADQARAGFRSPQSIQRALGQDPAKVAAEIAEDKARRDRLGIKSDADPSETTGSGISQYPRPASDEDGTLIPNE
jgi:capsid protein